MADTLADKRLEEFLKQAPNASREEIREFRGLLEQYFTGELPADQFKARRLHMGTYGIRAQEGVHMMRIKIPEGMLNAEQLECLAWAADTYSKGIGHITTRQDMQLYWIPTKEAPLMMARAAAVGLTTREACGNSVRNVTACPYAGVSSTEVFDVTPHADAVTHHMLRNEASQKLPRKFKIAFEGCPQDHAKTAIHDVGAVAAFREEAGRKQLGFRIYLGGGLGAAPMQAVLLEPFTPAEDLLRTVEAAVRVHDRLGDRKNKATARLKFVAKRMGHDAFRKEVLTVRATLPQYTYPAMQTEETDEQPPKTQDIPSKVTVDDGFSRWERTNILPQKQGGYAIVTVRLRLGDITGDQMRALAAITRRFCGGRLRTSIEQNLILRWVRKEHLKALYNELNAIGLAEAEAHLLRDVTSCPGAETCQLGISASRGLARNLEKQIQAARLEGADVEPVRIKVSGCPNGCGQHYIADIGFFGSARKINDRLVPHFQLMLGGLCEEGVAEFGKSILKLPARRIPEAVMHLFELYRKERQSEQESFRDYTSRMGVAYWRKALEPFTTLPAFESNPEAYRDWGAETDFSLVGMGPGECAA